MSEGPDLRALEAAIADALETQDDTALKVLGYGEISAVVGWPTEAPQWACKRLPPFPSHDGVEAYRACLVDYLDALRTAGANPLATELAVIPAARGFVGYCVQPVLDSSRLAPTRMARAGDDHAADFFERVVELVCDVVTPQVGLDGQLSNWAEGEGGELVYLDVTTPMLRDERGRDRLDPDLFLASLPWATRGFVKRFLIRGILEKYFQQRGVLLDIAGNLIKEHLAERIPLFLELANARLTTPISLEEAGRYYRGDARTWALLQRLRRLDRQWQRCVRRRVYPFLIPNPIDRRLSQPTKERGHSE